MSDSRDDNIGDDTGDDTGDKEDPTRRVERLRRLLERTVAGAQATAAGATRDTLVDQVSGMALDVVERLGPRPGADAKQRPPATADDYLEFWSQLGMRHRSEEVDPFGYDAVYERRMLPMLDFLYRKYFRAAVVGIENVPSSGRCVIVANHSGTLPLDGLMLRTALRLDHPAARPVRFLSEDSVHHLPFAGALLTRLGGVRACPENAELLLEKDAAIAVFPEGAQGPRKLFQRRYRLQRFGRGGFVRLAIRQRAPIIPCAIVGAEEANPLLLRDDTIAPQLGLPFLPITPTFPLLGPAGLLPAPTKWTLSFGEPVDLSEHAVEAADDAVLVARLSEEVRASIRRMLDTVLDARQSVFFG